ncbi:hypothetical protein A3838_07790 [Streptomyces badius]|nr:hypothetical protein A3838_07790 [Streptomyces badius]
MKIVVKYRTRSGSREAPPGKNHPIIGSSAKARARVRLISGALSSVAACGVFVIDIRVILHVDDLER